MTDKTKQTPLRVLLVEDNKNDTQAFKLALKKSKVHCKITHHKQVKEALEHIHSDTTAFDIVVSNYELPDKTGLDLYKELRETGSNTPFALLTSKGSDEVEGYIQAIEAA